MVPLTPVPTEFAGRVLVAKLGSAGILAEVRGTSQVYPSMFGRPEVWVEAEEEAEARELITTDTEDELPSASPPEPVARTSIGGRGRLVVAVVALVLLVGLSVGGRSCAATTGQSSAHTH
jgi:hypothetical protein